MGWVGLKRAPCLGERQQEGKVRRIVQVNDHGQKLYSEIEKEQKYPLPMTTLVLAPLSNFLFHGG